MRVADYIFKYLAEYGVEHVFVITGGGAMHLNDALKNERRIKYICNHHEQASAIAAEGYSRVSGNLAVVSVTSGPGGTNALTGVLGQWLDSVPVLYLSGQVKFETTLASCSDIGLRQLGDQEINIVDIVKPMTKYATMVADPTRIRAELEKAIRIATSGRPGPVWLDIPLNVQGALIEEQNLQGECMEHVVIAPEDETISQVVDELQKAKRPLLVAGHGIRIAKAQKEFLGLVDLINIPVVSTFNGFDLIASESNHFIGRIGTLGSRAGNFALQNSDFVVFLGTRNNIRQASYNWSSFASRAKKIIVDIDEAELRKPTVKGDILIHSDANVFITKLLGNLPKGFQVDKPWLEWCQARKKQYPVVLDEYKKPNEWSVHPYHFIEELTGALDENAIVVAGNGTACVGLFHAGIVKLGQRIFWNSGCAAMGYDLPAAIGAAFAGNRDVICLAGDGSIQMNLQELQVIKHYDLPIKIFILNNQGYHSIRMTQAGFFEGNFIGCDEDCGVSFPDNAKLADLYGLNYFRIDSTVHMRQGIINVLSSKGGALCEVILDADYGFAPRLASRKESDGRMISNPLEDMSPLLPRNEFGANMIIVADDPE
ncbi:MAG: Acetolactate synthase [Candidatus Wolfebacteria bacterium GW2011_GWC2_46_275]|nr:MAG: Acetolactate synthase [Candidatus Wolfebacteria bacterium GW2011_GWC2_46_275]KKU53758.1 MAG: Acetolactate synthase [Candidatus Wolfebacteria bacterium GW2011_GWC1_47_103]KKU59877.1 MAG: Acetolactate synthase [Candidatus Wolfebacteria bacterium GW2011_GWE2_47_12]KKU73141.1 MAG: Acetolactate synthase [Candidatus Wolfebacteria bacterium GW2011_GWB1_47_243]KKU76426.1 MAG: Acetolactate synthase [Candidatus Wolfebacteria bacterium GW2011_GWA1_47_6]